MFVGCRKERAGKEKNKRERKEPMTKGGYLPKSLIDSVGEDMLYLLQLVWIVAWDVSRRKLTRKDESDSRIHSLLELEIARLVTIHYIHWLPSRHAIMFNIKKTSTCVG